MEEILLFGGVVVEGEFNEDFIAQFVGDQDFNSELEFLFILLLIPRADLSFILIKQNPNTIWPQILILLHKIQHQLIPFHSQEPILSITLNCHQLILREILKV